jgi:membrane protein YqaA with SNARE-associated domain
MHGGGEANEAAALGFGPAVLLVETDVLGLGMLRAGYILGTVFGAVLGVILGAVLGVILGGELGARAAERRHAGEDEENGKAESGCGTHAGDFERPALNHA